MLLGTMVGKFSDEAVAEQALIDLQDISLLARLNLFSAEQGLTTGQTIRIMVNSFEKRADADSWAQLMSRINNTEDPGRAALKYMLEFSLPRK